MSLLVLRADADAKMGGGHFMRLLAIGQQWVHRGGSVLTVSHEPPGWLAVRAQELGSFAVQSRRAPDPEDAQGLITLIQDHLNGQGQAVVCADGYHFDLHFQKALDAASLPLLLVDDIADRAPYAPNVLLNQNVDADQLPYRLPEATRALLGTDYSLIRDEFFRVQRRLVHPKQARRLLVTMGASDPQNLSLETLEAIVSIGEECEVTIVLGGSYGSMDELNDRIASGTDPVSVTLVRNPPSMAVLMAEAEMAITAGGSTCWEAAFLGLPSLVRVFVANQTGIADGLHRRGAAESLGWPADNAPGQLAARIRALMLDQSRRTEMSQRARLLVDGRGRERVCDVLEQLMAEPEAV